MKFYSLTSSLLLFKGFSRIFHILPLDGLMYSEDTHILGEVQGNNQVCDCATKRVERTGASLSGSREPQTVTLLGKAASAGMVKLQISSRGHHGVSGQARSLKTQTVGGGGSQGSYAKT